MSAVPAELSFNRDYYLLLQLTVTGDANLLRRAYNARLAMATTANPQLSNEKVIAYVSELTNAFKILSHSELREKYSREFHACRDAQHQEIIALILGTLAKPDAIVMQRKEIDLPRTFNDLNSHPYFAQLLLQLPQWHATTHAQFSKDHFIFYFIEECLTIAEKALPAVTLALQKLDVRFEKPAELLFILSSSIMTYLTMHIANISDSKHSSLEFENNSDIKTSLSYYFLNRYGMNLLVAMARQAKQSDKEIDTTITYRQNFEEEWLRIRKELFPKELEHAQELLAGTPKSPFPVNFSIARPAHPQSTTPFPVEGKQLIVPPQDLLAVISPRPSLLTRLKSPPKSLRLSPRFFVQSPQGTALPFQESKEVETKSDQHSTHGLIYLTVPPNSRKLASFEEILEHIANLGTIDVLRLKTEHNSRNILSTTMRYYDNLASAMSETNVGYIIAVCLPQFPKQIDQTYATSHMLTYGLANAFDADNPLGLEIVEGSHTITFSQSHRATQYPNMQFVIDCHKLNPDEQRIRVSRDSIVYPKDLPDSYPVVIPHEGIPTDTQVYLANLLNELTNKTVIAIREILLKYAGSTDEKVCASITKINLELRTLILSIQSSDLRIQIFSRCQGTQTQYTRFELLENVITALKHFCKHVVLAKNKFIMVDNTVYEDFAKRMEKFRLPLQGNLISAEVLSARTPPSQSAEPKQPHSARPAADTRRPRMLRS